MEPGGGQGDDRAAMIAVLAHTMMNSVAAVLGLLDTLVERYGSLDDHQRREMLGRVRNRVAFDFDMLMSIVRMVSVENEPEPEA